MHPATAMTSTLTLKRLPMLAAIAALAVCVGPPASYGDSTLSQRPTASAAAWQPLAEGDQGGRVRDLQSRLHLTADGVFGSATAAAVRAFQSRHGLNPDAIVGAATWAAIKRAASTPSKATAVKLLQRLLGLSQDGVFGPATQAAVINFQSSHGLGADGVVGPMTWRALGVNSQQPKLERVTNTNSASPDSPAAVAMIVRAANRIATLPYKWGGGHGQWSDSGYDCSGTVSYVLHGAGRLQATLDAGELMSYGVAGRGRWVTIYANHGHTFMVINGRRYDSSALDENGSRWAKRLRPTGQFVARHPVGM